jgi:DNA-binding NarL/FixJ family response regulator
MGISKWRCSVGIDKLAGSYKCRNLISLCFHLCGLVSPKSGIPMLESLPPALAELLNLACQGVGTKAIAKRLGLSYAGLMSRVSRLLKMTGHCSLRACAFKALSETGLVDGLERLLPRD